MDQSQRYPFMFPPPRSLTERLKAEANGHAPAAEDLTPSIMAIGNGDGTAEPAPSAVTRGNGSSDAPAPPLTAGRNGHDDATPSLMARRFAPDGIPEDRHVQVDAPLAPAVQTRALAPWGVHVLIVVLVLVALVPSTTLGAMVWLGMLPAPWMRGAPHDGVPSAIEQASVTATLAPATTLPKQAMEVPAVALSAPDSVDAQAGQEVPFAITLDGTDALPARSIIAVSGLPVGASFSEGRPYGETEWTFRPNEIGDLKLLLPSRARGEATLKVQLAAADGRKIASAETTLKVAPDPKAALVLRSEEATLTADLIAHGNKMVGVGYFPGARAYFGRAAEAGSGDAALAMGETYDPDFIAKMRAQGIKPEPDQAIAWYERARALGAAGAADKIAALKLAAKEAAPDSDPPPLTTGDAQAATDTSAPVDGVTPDGAAADLVELKGFVNVRESPSSNAATVRVMDNGTKLRVIARKGGWVQVTDPATAETGWVYSRYVASVGATAGQ
ncbi:MAG: SH3 domain-containing protein [Methyloceanibacter sp.]